MKKLLLFLITLLALSNIVEAKLNAKKTPIQLFWEQKIIQLNKLCLNNLPFDESQLQLNKTFKKKVYQICQLNPGSKDSTWKDTMGLYVIQYNASGIVNKILNYTFTNGKRDKGRTVFSNFVKMKYDAYSQDLNLNINGYQSSLYTQQFLVGKTWTDSIQTIYTLSNGLLTNVLEKSYEPLSKTLKDDAKYSYTYDAGGNIIATYTEFFDPVKAKFVAYDGIQIIYKKDVSNRIIQTTIKQLNTDSNAYYVVRVEKYKDFNANKQFGSLIMISVDSNGHYKSTDSVSNITWYKYLTVVKDPRVYNYFYCGGDRSSSFILNKLDSNNKWAKYEKYDKSFNLDSNVTLDQVATYNTDSGKFITDSKTTYEYNKANLVKSYYFYLYNNLWTFGYLNYYYDIFDVDGDIKFSYYKQLTSSYKYYPLTVYDYTFKSAVEELNLISNSQLTIYPNPSAEIIYFKSNSGQTLNIKSINIFDLSGRRVAQNEVNNNNSLFIGQLNAGTYIMEVLSKDNASTKVRFVKE